MSIHVVIPDTQARPGVPTDHLRWIGRYLVDQFATKPNVTIIHLGDHWDMPSLSSYDKGKKAMEGRRYVADIAAGNEAFDELNSPLEAYNDRVRNSRAHTKKLWKPRKIILRGNHEYRIERAVECDAQLEGLLSYDDLNDTAWGWEVVPFLEVIDVDGVAYSHYFYNPMNGRPYSGTIDNRLKSVGHSFTMGHQQQLLTGIRYALDRPIRGLIAGACYLHDEDYKGPQGNAHWRGIIVCHEVEDGFYNLMEVSLDYLCRRYEGVPLSEFLTALRGAA